MITIFPTALQAADDFDKNVHYFQPPVDGSGVILTYGSEPLNWFGLHYGVYADEAIGHLTYEFPSGKRDILISNQTGVNALFAVGLSKFFTAGVAFPFVPYREMNEKYKDEVEGIETTSLEDIRIEGKGILLNRRSHCIGLAAALTVSVPVGNDPNSFLSDTGLTYTPRFIFDVGRHRWSAAFNVGYKRYTEYKESWELGLEVKDEIVFGLGAKLRFASYNELMVDSVFRTQTSEFFSNQNADYGEIMGAYRFIYGNYSLFAFTVGAGAGVMKGAGTPSVRMFIGVTSYEHHLEL